MDEKGIDEIGGAELAQSLQLGLEYAPAPPFNSGSQALSAGSGAGVSQGVVIGVAVGVTAFVLLVAIIVCTFKLRQKKATTIVKAIPTTTINNPIAQSSATSGVEMKDAI
jgi:hypothetical protein